MSLNTVRVLIDEWVLQQIENVKSFPCSWLNTCRHHTGAGMMLYFTINMAACNFMDGWQSSDNFFNYLSLPTQFCWHSSVFCVFLNTRLESCYLQISSFTVKSFRVSWLTSEWGHQICRDTFIRPIEKKSKLRLTDLSIFSVISRGLLQWILRTCKCISHTLQVTPHINYPSRIPWSNKTV